MSGMYTQELLGSSPTWRNSLHLGLGTGAERYPRPVECPRSRHHHLRKVLNSLLLVSSDTLTQLAHYVRKLRTRNLEIGTQFRDSENEQRNLEIVQIPRLRGTYTW